MSRTPEKLAERASTATKEVAKAVFNTRVGRFLLASATLAGATAMVAENVTSADEAAKSCLDFRYNPNVLVRGTSFEDSSSVKFEVLVSEPCRVSPNNPNARLVKVEADLNYPFTNKKQSSPDKNYNRVTIPLFDDGTNGDLIAGDNKYTAELRFDSTNPLEIDGIKGLSAETPFSSGGITMAYADNIKKTNGKSPDLYVVDRSIIPPDFKVEQRGNGIQASEHVINIRDDAVNVSRLLTHSLEDSGTVLANRVYKEVVGGSDPWQFLQFSSDNRSLLAAYAPTYEELGMPIRRDFAGTGGAGSSGSGTEIAEQYGSKGNLRMMIFTANPVKLYAWLNGFTHWGAGLNLPAALGLTDQSVWKGNMLPGGLLGGIPVQDVGDGTFKSLGGPRSVPKMSKIEKYLFGLIPKEQVPPAYIASKDNIGIFEAGNIISKFDKKVTIDEIIAAIGGVRTPGPGDPNLLKDFKAGHIYTTTGRMATREEMFVQDIITKRRGELWKEATDGLSTMQFVVPEASVNQKPETPELINRYNGRTLPDMTSGVSINFKPTDKMKWMQYQLIPANNDGPGVNMLIGDPAMIAKGAYKVEAPKDNEGPYILLPGQGYTERVRASSSVKQPDPNKDVDWSSWVTDTLRTPNPGSEAVKLVEPSTGITIQSLNPDIRWVNQPGFFYYELQVSEDPSFETDPSRAIAAVYWNMVHGGLTHNTWEPPKGALKPGTKYNARIRPRVQGDGQEAAWSPPIIFNTSGSARFDETRRQASWKPDAIYPDGAIGPSAEDMAQFGR